MITTLNDQTPSSVHANTLIQVEDNWKNGLYYNSAYEIENFVQVYSDKKRGDPFKVLNDPTYNGFKLFFHFDTSKGILADERHVNSGLAYLKRIGSTERYDLLKRFITTLSKVNSICPWIFQEIEGLKELHEMKRSEPRHDYEIRIRTLETIDYKIQSLNEMYRHIIFDDDRYCYVLPENLREFSMSIYVYDFRQFDVGSQTAIDFFQTIKNQDVKKLNHVMFDLGGCEFTEASGGDFFTSVNNASPVQVDNNFVISGKDFTRNSMFKSITGGQQLNAASLDVVKRVNSVTTGVSENEDPSFIDRLRNSRLFEDIQTRKNEYAELLERDTWRRKLTDTKSEVEQRAAERIEAELTRLYFGNVNGFGIDDLLRLNQDGGFRTAFNQIYAQQKGTQSLALGNTQADELGNINM